ncbi:ABC transporter permease [Limobrevibacterium gyesilva]|uniref:ABC transporter permease n=1 Tax=Limobrevibacterium gyesilva TaxID=2991712 RepID=A0AA41YJB6_9PROT|nr:ABC transporter permease [Limobrevibacterium gyesilva]MCW3474749.1 ABC transporter permease [Limobrevibacterium gyesilva]
MLSLFTKPRGVAGLAIVLAVGLIVTFAPLLAPFDPTQSSVFFLAPPDAERWMGTDDLGRDTFSRLLYGGRSSLIVGMGAAVIATLVGVPIGLAAGYLGGKFDVVARQFIDLFIALPGLVLALIITAVMGPTLFNLVLVLGFVSWPKVARLARGQALAIRESVFVEASRAVGAGPAWIIHAHIWPNVVRIIAAQFALTVAYSIFTSASLSFLGLGVPPPTPDWGAMVRTGFDYLALNPSMSMAPSGAVALTVFGFYLIGTSIE